MARITRKSTKEVIYTALQEKEKEIAKLKAEAKGLPVPDEVAVSSTESEAINISTNLVDAKNAAVTEISKLVDEIDEGRRTLAKLKSEVKDTYDIKTNLHTLEALVNRQNEITDEFNKEVEVARSEWEKEKESNQEAFEQEMKQRDSIRKKDQEEYQYKRRIERERNDEEFKHHKEKQAQELAETQASYEKVWQEKGLAIASQENHIRELEEAVANHPEEVKKAVSKEVAIVTNKMKRDHDFELKQAGAEKDNEIENLKNKFAVLEDRFNQLQQEKVELLSKLDLASKQVETIATEAIKSGNNVSVITPKEAKA